MTRIVLFLLIAALLLASCAAREIPVPPPPGETPAAITTAPEAPLPQQPQPQAAQPRSESEPPPPLPVTDPAVFAPLGEEADKIALSHGVDGCSLAVFEGGEILYTHSYGTASARGGVRTAADGHTKYRVASISKMVSMMLAMTLVEQGKLSLDDELAALIDERLYSPGWPEDKPTLFHLLTHTSGIVDGAVYNSAISRIPFPPLETVLGWGSPFTGEKPGDAYLYSNFGMGLVAAAVEKASGEYFYDYAEKTLFAPVGIDAGFLTDFIEDRDSVAALRSVDPLSWGTMLNFYNGIPLGQMYLLAQGELYISAADLANITMILAGGGELAGKRYLSGESLELIHQPYIRDDTLNVTRGLVVQISDDIVDGVTLYGHQGNAYGVISCVFYDPATARGVVFLTNGSSAATAGNQVYSVNDAITKTVWKYFA